MSKLYINDLIALEANTLTQVSIKSEASSTNGYTAPKDGYVRFINQSATGGLLDLQISGLSFIKVAYNFLYGDEVISLFVKKGMVIKTPTATLNAFALVFNPLG